MANPIRTGIAFLTLMSVSEEAMSATSDLEYEVRSRAINIALMSGFYLQCSDMHLIEGEKYVLRWGAYISGKYFELIDESPEANRYFNMGQAGYLLEDPTRSIDPVAYEFNERSCAGIGEHMKAMADVVWTDVFSLKN